MNKSKNVPKLSMGNSRGRNRGPPPDAPGDASAVEPGAGIASNGDVKQEVIISPTFSSVPSLSDESHNSGDDDDDESSGDGSSFSDIDGEQDGASGNEAEDVDDDDAAMSLSPSENHSTFNLSGTATVKNASNGGEATPPDMQATTPAVRESNAGGEGKNPSPQDLGMSSSSSNKAVNDEAEDAAVKEQAAGVIEAKPAHQAGNVPGGGELGSEDSEGEGRLEDGMVAVVVERGQSEYGVYSECEGEASHASHEAATPRSTASSSRNLTCLKIGQVWKLGRMWSVGSTLRLWRTRFLVVQEGFALIFTDEKCWRSKETPKNKFNLRGATVEKVPGRSSGRWVFSIKGDCISKEMFIAAGTEIDRDLWIIALRNSIASVPHDPTEFPGFHARAPSAAFSGISTPSRPDAAFFSPRLAPPNASSQSPWISASSSPWMSSPAMDTPPTRRPPPTPGSSVMSVNGGDKGGKQAVGEGGLGPVVAREQLMFSKRRASQENVGGGDGDGGVSSDESGSDVEGGFVSQGSADYKTARGVGGGGGRGGVTTHVSHMLLGRSTVQALVDACSFWFSDPSQLVRLRALRGAWDALATAVADGADAGAEDPAERVKGHVQASWRLVEKDIEGHGVKFFMRIFEIAPPALQLFSFKDVEELEKSPQLRKHASNVMRTVGQAVAGLSDVKSLVPVLQKLGARHAKYGVQPEHFGIVGQALLWTLEQGLGGAGAWTPEVKDAWTKTYATVQSAMEPALASEIQKRVENDLRVELEASRRAESDLRETLEARKRVEMNLRETIEARKKVESKLREELEASREVESDLSEALQASRMEVEELKGVCEKVCAELDGMRGDVKRQRGKLDADVMALEDGLSAARREMVRAGRGIIKLEGSGREDEEEKEQLAAALEASRREVEELKGVCGEMERAIGEVESINSALDEKLAEQVMIKDEEIRVLMQRVEELEGSNDGARVAEQLLGQLEMLKMSSSQQLPASDQEIAASQGEFTAVAADPRLLGQSGLGFGLGSQPSAEEGSRMERELAELRAKISDLEASQIEAMVEKQRLIAENKAAVKSRQRAQEIMARIVDQQQVQREEMQKEQVDASKAWSDARSFIAQIQRSASAASSTGSGRAGFDSLVVSSTASAASSGRSSPISGYSSFEDAGPNAQARRTRKPPKARSKDNMNTAIC